MVIGKMSVYCINDRLLGSVVCFRYQVVHALLVAYFKFGIEKAEYFGRTVTRSFR